jgi:hypothetical protein
MVSFIATIKKFADQGEKTGWTYIEIPAAIAAQLKPGTKKTFRVKGKLDAYSISGVALLPMGAGDFIMALNATMRKGLKKVIGTTVAAKLEWDAKEMELPAVFLDCLADEPEALAQFNRLSRTHKGYFRIWITSVKSEAAQAKRIAQAVNALAKGQNFSQMVRSLKKERNDYP